MTTVLMVSLLVFGYLFGACACRVALQELALRQRKRALGFVSASDGEVGPRLQSTGVAAALVGFMRRESVRVHEGSLPEGLAGRLLLWGAGGLSEQLGKAGVSQVVSVEGVVLARGKLALALAVAGLLLGIFFSWQLSLLLGLLGFAGAFGLIPWALKAEMRMRRVKLESELSEMLEVVVLGLSGGLSFERSLHLYCQHFPTFLSEAFGNCLKQWKWGITTRDQSLKDLASQFDSPLLTRVADSMVRSLRFGVPAAGVLSELATEAREARKAYLQEQVAKAPVKMMVPVGALILPAMLLLVMGPVLLELMNGF